MRAIRDVYLWRKPLIALLVVAAPLAYFAWIGSASVETRTTAAIPVRSTDSCAARAQPRAGIYKWYGPAWGQDIAQLTIQTASGSNYFIKLVDATGATARAYFMHGGTTQTFPVPLGLFTLKYATGQSWCGENDYFGGTTIFSVADKTLDFDQQIRPDPDGVTTLTSDVTVELVRQRNGNLPTHTIPRSQF